MNDAFERFIQSGNCLATTMELPEVAINFLNERNLFSKPSRLSNSLGAIVAQLG
jgi:hypothetical protein